MTPFVKVTDELSASPQIEEADFADYARLGFKTVINNRPDGESDDTYPSAAAAEIARAHGLNYVYIPIRIGSISAEDVSAFAKALRDAGGPVLAHCRSGLRSTLLWAMASVQMGGISVDDAIAKAAAAGFDISKHREKIEAFVVRKASLGQRLAALFGRGAGREGAQSGPVMADNAEIARYQQAFRMAEEVCREAANGNLDARITGIDELGEFAGMLNGINRVLDLTDSYIRESGASLEYAGQGKFYRPFLLRGMKGDFRRGAEGINTARQNMQAMAEEARSQRRNMADGFEASISGMVGQVRAAAGDMADKARQMADNAGSTHETSRALADASERAAANVHTAAAATRELSASIGEISHQVAESTVATGAAVEETRRANDTVMGLATAAQEIDKVAVLIRDIAAQTNLLALNATIEAARAGEAGKGFAVVASEVKSLADQTTRATDEIAAQIAAIQGSSSDTIEAIETIGERIVRVDGIVTTISAAVEQQSAATGEISGTAQNLATGTEEVSGSISRITDNSRKTGQAAREVLEATEGVMRQADALGEEVGKFLADIRNAR